MDPMGDGAFVTGSRHGLPGEPGFPLCESNDSDVHDSVSIHPLLTQAFILKQAVVEEVTREEG